MKKKTGILLASLIIVFLVFIYTLASTYAVIINVTENDGENEIVNQITIRDLVTDDTGNYNSYYYDVKDELNITDYEANILIESDRLNENLQVVLNSIVDYKLDNNIDAKLSDDEIYNLILEGVNNTEMSDDLRNKVINKSNVYKNDISNFLYDIDVNLIG